MGVVFQEASGGDIDLGDGGGTANGHLVVEEETSRPIVGSLVLDWSLV